MHISFLAVQIEFRAVAVTFNCTCHGFSTMCLHLPAGLDVEQHKLAMQHPLLTGLIVLQSSEASYHVALGPLATGAVLGAHWQPLPSYAELTTHLMQRMTAFLNLLPRRAPSACLGRR